METNINYTIVGAFVIFLLTAIVLAVIWLSSGFSFDQYTNYMIYMNESISGLNLDAPVEYNGVNVGSVKSIELNENDPKIVDIVLRVKSSTPIREGTEATLSTRGLTGLVYIALKDKGKDLRPLVVKDDDPYPVIKTAPSIFVRLDQALSQVSTNLSDMADSMQKVLSPDNQKAITNTLAHLDKFTATLESNSEKLDEIIRNTANLTLDLKPVVTSSKRTLYMIEHEALPLTYQALQNIETITRNLSHISDSMKQNPSILIRGNVPNLGPGETR